MSAVLTKCLQVFEIHHLKNNSSGDFLYFKMLRVVPIAFLFVANYFLSSIQFSFFKFHLLIVLQILSVLVHRQISKNHELEVDSKHILFDNSSKSRIISWQFSLINFRENPKTLKKKGEMKNGKER